MIAAVSKAIASTVAYPFFLAKARAQTSSARPVDTESAEKLKAFAKRSTVFDTILKIYRTEGAAALHEGVYGEILKASSAMD